MECNNASGTDDLPLFACYGAKAKFGDMPVHMCHNRTYLDEMMHTISANKLRCPAIRYAVSLINSSDVRRSLYVHNRKKLPSLQVVHSIDATDTDGTLAYWRQLGVPFITLHKSHPRSNGQFASQLTYIKALIQQHEQRIPFMYLIEDDLKIEDGHVFREVRCAQSAGGPL
jgi:hypothetical protein